MPDWQRFYDQIVLDILRRLRAKGIPWDDHPGSVIRTLVEAFAREMAVAYEQLGMVYDMGYIDTATDESLERLVAIMGQTRIDEARAEGLAVFKRNPRVTGRVSIPVGTELLLTDSNQNKQVLYSTTEAADLQVGQVQTTVPMAAPAPPGEGLSAVVFSESEIVQAQVDLLVPIAGVAEVWVDRPTAGRGRRESDEELRQRVKGLVAAAGGGTAKALQRVILAAGAEGVVLRDGERPGELDVVVDGDLTRPALFQAVQEAVAREKAPGILVRLRGIQKKKVAVQLKIKPSAGNLTAERRQTLRRSIEDLVTQTIGGLMAGDDLLWRPLMARVVTLDGVLDLLEPDCTIEVNGDPRPVGDVEAAALERIILHDQSPGVTVLFDEEPAVFARLSVDLPASSAPESERSDLEFDVARRLQEYLAEFNQHAGDRELDLEQVRDAVLSGGIGADPALAAISLEIQYVLTGAETVLSPDQPVLAIRAGESVLPHPAGPVITWSDAS